MSGGRRRIAGEGAWVLVGHAGAAAALLLGMRQLTWAVPRMSRFCEGALSSIIVHTLQDVPLFTVMTALILLGCRLALREYDRTVGGEASNQRFGADRPMPRAE